MTFGKRTLEAFDGPQSRGPTTAPRTRRGGYWLGLLTVPVVFATIALIGGLFQGMSFMDWLTVTPPSALSLTIVAAVVFLAADCSLRALGWRKPWLFAMVCGLVLYGLCFVTPVRGVVLVFFTLIPGLCGGWVLGWSRR